MTLATGQAHIACLHDLNKSGFCGGPAKSHFCFDQVNRLIINFWVSAGILSFMITVLISCNVEQHLPLGFEIFFSFYELAIICFLREPVTVD